METSNQTKTNERFSESAKIANKWFSDASSSMMDIYNKQLKNVSSFYTDFFNSILGAANKNSVFHFTNSLGNRNEVAWSFFNPFSWLKNENANLNPFASVYENIYKQFTDYNKNLLSTFQGNFQAQQNDSISLNERYQKVIEKEWEAIKNTLNAISEAYNGQLESATNSSKKLFGELNKQINDVMKNNSEFWTEAVKTYQANAKKEKDKKDEKSEILEPVH